MRSEIDPRGTETDSVRAKGTVKEVGSGSERETEKVIEREKG